MEKIGVSPDYLLPVPKEAIPKTAIGKIQRQELRKRFEAGEFDGCISDWQIDKQFNFWIDFYDWRR